MKEKILGLITVPDHIYSVKDESTIFPTHKDFGFIYLSVNEFPIQDYMIYNQIIVDIDDTDKIDETKRNIENNIKSAIAVTDRNASSSYQSYNS